MNEIIVAGGSGFIGGRLAEVLVEKGYKVNILTRKARKSLNQAIEFHIWDPEKGVLSDKLIESAHGIVNLTGASLGAHRWTKSYKKEVVNSRVHSTELIVNKLNKLRHEVRVLVNGSAIGYYGPDKNKWLKESDPPGEDFTAEICVQWEAAAQKLQNPNVRLVISRTGIVLSSKEGALLSMAKPVKLGIGSPLGSGRQAVPWIHIDDMCSMLLAFIENDNLHGPYNAVGPEPVSNKDLTKAIAKELHKPLLMPAVPGSMLNLILGEFADSIRGSYRVSAEKIMASGFHFLHPEIGEALHDLYSRNQ
jgi:uncharacterized protein (TIGR01777 family)